MNSNKRFRPTPTTLSVATLIAASLALAACDNTSQDASSAYARGNYKAAHASYSKLASEGDRDAQFTLGLMYFEGTGPDKDLAEALRWYRRAASQGQTMAQNNLGAMLMDGKGAPQDFAEAAFWLSLVANAGDPHAGQLRDAVSVHLGPAAQEAVSSRVKNWQPKREAGGWF